MRYYPIPPDTQEEEKIIGGVLTLKQFFWILAGLLLGGGALLGIFSLTNSIVLGLIFFLLILGAFAPFAFYKKYDMPLAKYLKVKRKFKNKTKYLVNRRSDV